jgi:hypothetical protein
VGKTFEEHNVAGKGSRRRKGNEKRFRSNFNGIFGQEWEIWVGGCRTKDVDSMAGLIGTARGDTFKKACQNYFDGDKNFQPSCMRHWGCKLFDNEADAMRDSV